MATLNVAVNGSPTPSVTGLRGDVAGAARAVSRADSAICAARRRVSALRLSSAASAA